MFKSFVSRALRTLMVAAPAGLIATAAPAATLTLGAGGQLLGASGVVVGGVSYDVSFVDGTCAGLYGGCDATADFTFNTIAQAHAASTALVSQVYNAAAATDADPTLTRGCESSGYFYLGARFASCYALTPFGFTMGGQVATHVALNDIRDSFDLPGAPDTQFVIERLQSMAGTSGTGAVNTFAVWSRAGSGGPSPTPAPASALLAALGLLALRVTTAGSRPAR
jgi:hypothetical protein